MVTYPPPEVMLDAKISQENLNDPSPARGLPAVATRIVQTEHVAKDSSSKSLSPPTTMQDPGENASATLDEAAVPVPAPPVAAAAGGGGGGGSGSFDLVLQHFKDLDFAFTRVAAWVEHDGCRNPASLRRIVCPIAYRLVHPGHERRPRGDH